MIPSPVVRAIAALGYLLGARYPASLRRCRAGEAVRRATTRTEPAPALLRVEVLATYPHDTQAFTQGLILAGGVLYESIGRYFRSAVRRVEVASGTVLEHRPLPASHFGEGLARVEDRLVQLTWRNGVAHVYDVATLDKLRPLSYAGEGWGLAFDGVALVMSDGTERLTFRDPATFAVIREVSVTREGQPVDLLNELECVGDVVYANVWQTSTIVEISARDGVVRAVVDASGLLSPAEAAELPAGGVLNGIAYDAETQTFLVTGKFWPKLFRVRFVSAATPSSPPGRGT